MSERVPMERVLFELRIHTDEDEWRVDVYESAEWQAYHRARRVDRGGGGPVAWVKRLCREDDDSTQKRSDPRKRTPPANDLRRALDSLQTFYDDLYGDATA